MLKPGLVAIRATLSNTLVSPFIIIIIIIIPLFVPGKPTSFRRVSCQAMVKEDLQEGAGGFGWGGGREVWGKLLLSTACSAAAAGVGDTANSLATTVWRGDLVGCAKGENKHTVGVPRKMLIRRFP